MLNGRLSYIFGAMIAISCLAACHQAPVDSSGNSENKVVKENLEPAQGIVCVSQTLPAGSPLLPQYMIYLKADSQSSATSAEFFYDKAGLAGAVLARSLQKNSPIKASDLAAPSGSKSKKTERDVLISTSAIEAGAKLDESNLGYWTPTPNYRPMLIQLAVHDLADTKGCVATQPIKTGQIISLASFRKVVVRGVGAK